MRVFTWFKRLLAGQRPRLLRSGMLRRGYRPERRYMRGAR